MAVIAPRDQWAIQVDVTTACNRRCSNCTRPAVAHLPEPIHMHVPEFRTACRAARAFAEQAPDRLGRKRIVGMIGGEPLLHPEFPDLCRIMAEELPPGCRGLWTGLEWQRTKHAVLIRDTFGLGYLNNNQHKSDCYHQPVLVASGDVVPDPAERASLINSCPMQEEWASSITTRGFFFCEVAGALADVLPGPGGMPVEQGIWNLPLSAYEAQRYYCNRCGVCLPLAGRRDSEEVDDISQTNLELLRAGSPRIAQGKYSLFDGGLRDRKGWAPCKYLRSNA